MKGILPLHLCHVSKSSLIINRLYIFLHGIALTALIYYRITSFSEILSGSHGHGMPFMICYVLIFVSELILTFLWLLSQSYRWKPAKRTVFPERLPDDKVLPAIDVFVCTADPSKEPSFEVMNTVISAMALDYPPEKLNVYLSDDGGSSVTLKAIKEAWKFASCWLPFCRKYGIKTRCPETFFSGNDDSGEGGRGLNKVDFVADKKTIQERYELFRDRLQWLKDNTITIASKDHPSRIEVIADAAETEMPFLVYVSREKRPFHPHNFKAGALNALLRVSGVMSNSPYILVLDCDMQCNDPSSARQAMCLHLDNSINSDLAFVQFPQKFHNISAKDIYDSQLRFFMTMQAYGADGVGGTTFMGTGFYLKREPLYGTTNLHEGSDDLCDLHKIYGPSIEFIKSTNQRNPTNDESLISSSLIKETEFLASCTYEKETQWGKQVGFKNDILEDYCTSLLLFGKGWKSVYLNPSKPAFLGSATTNLSDFLVQHTRWYTGLFRVFISEYCPLIYGPARGRSILRSMFFAQLSIYSLNFFPLWCLSIIPQLCLLRGVSLYPRISDPFFIVFAFVFLSSNLKHVEEVLSDGLSIRSWIYEQRMWMIKGVTCYTYGTLNAIMSKIGLAEATFFPTNKVPDEGQHQRYHLGMYDFQASTTLIAPICTLVTLNCASLILGAVGLFGKGNYDEMLVQFFITLFVVVIQYPVIEGMLFRKDNGRVSRFAAFVSVICAAVILALGSLLDLH